MAKIMHQVVIESDPATIYDALTSQQGLSQWWINDCDAKPEIGHMNEFRAEGHGIHLMEVILLDPNRQVQWRCRNEEDEWTDSTIRFIIGKKQTSCTLTFEHDGWRAQNDYYAICSYHWARHLTLLAKYCETGQGQVNPESERDEVRRVMSD